MSTELVQLAPEADVSRPADAELLERTLAAATKQRQTVHPDGVRVHDGLEGVIRTHVPTHVDERGWLVELFDPRAEQWTEPFAYAYATSVRPGYAKGWGLHKEHDDRYTLLFGHVEVLLYDVRPTSSTLGRLARYQLSEFDRGHLVIPAYVWHTMRNIGSTDVVVINFPTAAFDHRHPDKYSLPLNTDLIPFALGDTPGW
ncbi:MAG: dTDP-4-dehydrorhamnose 3,5-epimerase family protein [Candidatus Limnocylindrales bacterium]